MAKEIFAEYAKDEWDYREKIGSVALVLMALEIDPTESEWRDYLLISGLNIFDPEIEEACIDASVFYHYSGLISIDELEEDTWINNKHPYAFRGVTDEDFADKIESLKIAALGLRGILT